MLGHGAKLSHKMEQAIAALLSSRNVEDAARQAGIGTNTLRRWMRLPDFDAAYREARAALLSQAIGRLQGASGAAANTVLKIMLNPDVPAGARLRAAEIVLEQAARASSVEALEARIAELERKAGLTKGSRRASSITLLKTTPLAPPPSQPAQTEAKPDRAGSNETREE